jgi:hypothetical protein
MCHANQHWTEALPLVILGILTAFKADLQVSVADLVYDESLRIPEEILTPTADPVEPSHLISQHMTRIRPVLAARHASPATFVQNDLHKCTQVFLRQNRTRRALEPPYSGPTRSFHGERKHCNSWCVAGPSPYQLIESSRPTSSMGLTAGTSSTSQSTQPRP